MSCCNPLFGNGAPNTVLAPLASQLPFYVDLLGNTIYFWNGTIWSALAGAGSSNAIVTYNSTTRQLLVNGVATGTIPAAAAGIAGTIKLGANSAIKVNGAGELVIDCAILAGQCGSGGSGSVGTTASTTPPNSPVNGQLWTNTSLSTVAGIVAGATAYWSGVIWTPTLLNYLSLPVTGTTSGFVPTANSSGGWSWQAGSGTPLTNTTPSNSTTTAATPAFVNAAIAAIPSGVSALQPLMYTAPFTYDPGNGNLETDISYNFIGNTITQVRGYDSGSNTWTVVPPASYSFKNRPATTLGGVSISARSSIGDANNFRLAAGPYEITLSSGEVVILP